MLSENQINSSMALFGGIAEAFNARGEAGAETVYMKNTDICSGENSVVCPRFANMPRRHLVGCYF